MAKPRRRRLARRPRESYMAAMNAASPAPLPFAKMHGCGNDFVILDARGRADPTTPALARAVADRRRGVGFDQLIVLRDPKGEGDDVEIDFWNADGSISGACGNGARCAARLLMEESGRERVAMRSVAARLDCRALGGERVTVNMGRPGLGWRDIPLAEESDTIALTLDLADAEAAALPAPAAVSMGNPHAIFFVGDAEAVDIHRLGPAIETDPIFPERANVSFAEIRGGGSIRLRVWERGVGVTLACGSAACAVVVAGARREMTGRSATLQLDGGALEVEWSVADDCVYLSGPTRRVFAGEFSPEFLAEAADG